MSLTSNLKNKDSVVFRFFEDNLNMIDLFIKKENKSFSSLNTLLPKNEVNYPWSHIGHITEYLLDLHIGVPIEELFPMKYLKVLSIEKYDEIKNMKINRNKISSQFNEISSILYQLSVIETGLRNNPKDIHIPSISALKLSSDCINDLHNIYHQSIVSVGSKPDGKLVSILQSVFSEMCSIIGVLESTQGAVEAESCGLEEPLMEMLIAMRQEARSNKDYAQADALRNKLSEIGIVLEDTPQGVRWKKQ